MNITAKDFIEFVKKEYNCEIILKPCIQHKADTFEKLFGCNKNFTELDQTDKENLLMETAMMIMSIFDEMFYAQQLNTDKVDYDGSIERLRKFCDWSREFEIIYYGTEEYEDDYMSLINEWVINKLIKEYGKEN